MYKLSSKLAAVIVAAALSIVVLLPASPSPASALTGFPTFTHQGIIVNPPDLDFNPTGEYIFPTIIRAADYVANPLANYYLYAAPHNSAGSAINGIALFYADTPDGPWTEYAGNPVVPNDWPPYHGWINHVSSPHVIWNEDAEQFYMYYHGGNTITRLATSTDGINWVHYGPVVTTADFTGISEASYARVFEYKIPSKNNKYIMMLMGNNGGTRKIYLAWSNDGLNWTTQHAPLISPGTGEGGQLSAPTYFPWNGNHYVAYHSGAGNIHVTEVGAGFNLENHLGVLYDSTSGSPDEGRAASPTFYTTGTKMYMFYEQGDRLGARIAYATADLSTTNTWNLINDGMSDYESDWDSVGTTGSVTQHGSYITLTDASTGGYRYIRKKNYVPPTGAFTFEVRGKSTAAGATNEVSVRSTGYNIGLFIKHGTSGTVQNKATSPAKSYTLDTTTAHVYRVVVHADETYDLYVDGSLAWSGANGSSGSTNIFKIGGDTPYTASFDLDYVRMGTGEIIP